MRRAARVDANHGVIVAALRQVGASVQDLAAVGKGCPDLLVGYRGHNFVLEVKAPKGTSTPAQVAWHADWRGDVRIVRDVDEALHVIGAI
jgi:hypothetical protein